MAQVTISANNVPITCLLTDAQGLAQFSLPPGNYLLNIEHPDYLPEVRELNIKQNSENIIILLDSP